MNSIIVYDRGRSLGIIEVSNPILVNGLIIYEQIPFGINAPIDILYMPDLEYGIAITSKMLEHLKNFRKESI